MLNSLSKIFPFLLLLCGINSVVAQSKYLLPCNYADLTRSCEVLKKQVGVVEKTGNNDGIQVEKYLASVGLKKGNPYCNAGQYYCFAEVTPKPPMVRSGLAISSYNYGKQLGNKVPFIPEVHDLVIWNIVGTIFGHVERIIAVGQKGWVTTIGFNTSSSDPRNGNGVWIKKRCLYHPLARMHIKGLVGWKI